MRAFADRGRLFVAESLGEDLYAAMQKQTRREAIHRAELLDRCMK